MGYQEDRERRIHVFEDTLYYCEGNKNLLEAIEGTRKHTVLYQYPRKDCKDEADRRYNQPAKVSISHTHILETAKRLSSEYKGCRIGMLNLASAANPGGEVIRGGNTQEECFCRCSTLYPCLNTTKLLKEYYGNNGININKSYPDTCIYTPGIVFIKTDTETPGFLSEQDRFVVDIISCPVPDLRGSWEKTGDLSVKTGIFKEESKGIEAIRQRINVVLQAAADNQIEILILGVFDGSVFYDSPDMVEVLKKVLKEYIYSFKTIEFAVSF